MKHLILILILLACRQNVEAQIIIYDYCFDQTSNCGDYDMSDPEPVWTIDLSSNPNNIWQIGSPQKSVFMDAFSAPNALITDADSPYPINDTSAFSIEGTAMQSSSSINWANFSLSFNYYVDSDTLADFGTIEFSPDNGATWIDLIGDPVYSPYLTWTINQMETGVPVLTGSSDGWVMAEVFMRDLGVLLDIQPGTTFKWRFGFISDGIQNNRDGLMFDNISITITPPLGLDENPKQEEKNLVRVVDVLGRETEITPNTLLIFEYSDGSTARIFRVN